MTELAKVRTPPCPGCGHASTVKVDVVGLLAWKGGAHIQDAFPHMTAAGRELLLTGFHATCWDRMVAATEEE